MSKQKYISSKEIAILVDKEHGKVLISILDMLTELATLCNEKLDYKERYKKDGTLSELFLDKELALTYLTVYSLKFRYSFLKRYLEFSHSMLYDVIHTHLPA